MAVLGCRSTSTIFRIETGRSRPPPGNVRVLLELYGVTGPERDGLIRLSANRQAIFGEGSGLLSFHVDDADELIRLICGAGGYEWQMDQPVACGFGCRVSRVPSVGASARCGRNRVRTVTNARSFDTTLSAKGAGVEG